MQAVITAETALKSAIAPMAELSPSQRITVGRGENLAIANAWQERDQHRAIVLREHRLADDGETPLIGPLYVYDPHIDVAGEQLVVKLDVPYYRQVDNITRHQGPGNRQCNVTSTAMMLDYLTGNDCANRAKSEGFGESEGYFGYLLKDKYDADTTDHIAITRCLREQFDVESYWSRRLCPKDIRDSLERGLPVVIGVAYKASGHIVCMTGIDEPMSRYLVHDPYGIRFGASDRYDVGAYAAHDVYSFGLMDQIFWDQGPRHGWGRIVTAIAGKPTGMAAGL